MRVTDGAIITFAASLTLLAAGLWLATGRAIFTRYQVIEHVSAAPEEDDPLAATGFYGGDSAKHTVVRDEFRFGLLPAGEALLDRHMVSLATIAVPVWALALLGLWRRRARDTNRARGSGGRTDQ